MRRKKSGAALTEIWEVAKVHLESRDHISTINTVTTQPTFSHTLDAVKLERRQSIFRRSQKLESFAKSATPMAVAVLFLSSCLAKRAVQFRDEENGVIAETGRAMWLARDDALHEIGDYGED